MNRYVPTHLAFALVLALPSLTNAQSLEKAVKLMLYNEPEIQAANYDRLSAYEDWKIVRGDLRPQVTLDANAGYLERDRTTDGLVTSTGEGLFSRQISASIRQLIYDGGLARHQTISAARGYEVQELVERSMVEGRVVDLCEVYLEVLRAREQVQEAQAQVNRHKEMRDMLQEQIGKSGNRADLALVDGRLSLAVNAVESQQLAYENALIRFVRLTGEPASSLKYPAIPPLPKQQSGLDVNGNWDYQASVAALSAAEHKHRSVRGNRGPKIYLDAGGSVGRDVLGIEGEDDELRAMVVMSWDVYRGGANKALQQREHWQVRKAEELAKAAREQGEYLTSLLWKEREGSKASVKSLGSYVDRLEGVLADYREQFKVGRQDLLSILDVQGELYSAKTKLIDSRYNVDTTAYRLKGVEGSLTNLLVTEEVVRDYLDHDPDKIADDYGKVTPPENLRPVSGLPKDSTTPVRPVRVKAKPISASNAANGKKAKTKRLRLNPFGKSSSP